MASEKGGSSVSTSENRPNTKPRHPHSLPADVELLPWAARQLGISKSTAYRQAKAGKMPGAFQIGVQWRISVPSFMRAIHGEDGARIMADALHADAEVSS